MKYIDLETYPRRSHYEFFKAKAYPYVGMTANMDVTELVAKAKAMEQAAEEVLGKDAAITLQEAGFMVVLDIRTSCTAEELADRKKAPCPWKGADGYVVL